MSDDTPTRRYPDGFPPADGASGAGSQDALPTERFAAPGTEMPAGAPPDGPPSAPAPPSGSDGSQRRLVIALAVIGGVLLLAVIGLLIWIGVSSAGPAPVESPTPSAETPSPEPSPSETPSPEPSETAPPPPTNVIVSFTASTEAVDCAEDVSSVPVTFSWATNASTVWFGVGTDDAKLAPYDSYPGNHTLTDFPYQCCQPGGQQSYTISADRTDGSTQSQTIIVREQ